MELKARIEKKSNTARDLLPSFENCRMSIEITNICNHKCIFCPCGRGLSTRKKSYINDELCLRIIKEGYELGVREITFQIYGEPFINKNLNKYVQFAKQLGYSYVYLTTNGSLATPKKIDAILAAGLDSIKFSVNGTTKEKYLKIHGCDDFETVKRNIKYCNSARKNYNRKINLFISCVVTDKSMSEVQMFKDEFIEFVDDVVFYRADIRGGLVPENLKLAVSLPPLKQGRKCVQPFNGICISCEGMLSPCCLDYDLNLVIGNLCDSNLKDLYYSDKFIQFRESHINNDLKNMQCEKCLNSDSAWLTVLDL